MIKKITQASTLSLIITNCVLYAIAVYYQLTLFDILLIFWGETIIIAFFNFIKMTKVASIPIIPTDGSKESSQNTISKTINAAVTIGKIMAIFWSSVFISVFCLFQLVLIVALFGDETINGVKEFPLKHDTSFLIGMLVIFVSHTISLLLNFLRKKEYLELKLRRMILAPFRRILLVWIVVIAGAFILLKTESNSPYLLIPWFMIKILFDLRQHLKERKTNQGAALLTSG